MRARGGIRRVSEGVEILVLNSYWIYVGILKGFYGTPNSSIKKSREKKLFKTYN